MYRVKSVDRGGVHGDWQVSGELGVVVLATRHSSTGSYCYTACLHIMINGSDVQIPAIKS